METGSGPQGRALDLPLESTIYEGLVVERTLWIRREFKATESSTLFWRQQFVLLYQSVEVGVV